METALVSVSEAFRLAHVCSNFSRFCLYVAVVVSDVDAVEVPVLSVAPIDWMSCINCANELLALSRFPDERASPNEFKSLARVFEALVELVDVTDSALCELPETPASGGGGGRWPCICCMMFAKMLWALVRSPDERESPNALRSSAKGFEFVPVPDVDAVELPVLSAAPMDCMSCINCTNELLALVRSPDESASPNDFKSLAKVFEALVEPVDVTDSALWELPETPASGGGGGRWPCICCMMFAKMSWAPVRSPDESESPNALRSLANGFELVPVADVDAVELPVLSVAATDFMSCISFAKELSALISACMIPVRSVLIASELPVDSVVAVVPELAV